MLQVELQAIVNDRSLLRDDLKHLTGKPDAYPGLRSISCGNSTSSSDTGMASLKGLEKSSHGGHTQGNHHLPPPLPAVPPPAMPPPTVMASSSYNYERIKEKCDHMAKELQQLKQQYGEVRSKYEQASSDCDILRHRLKISEDRGEQISGENSSLKKQVSELNGEKLRAQQEARELQRLRQEDMSELVELRNQQKQVLSESGAYEGFSVMYVNRYEALKQEYEELQKHYTDSLASLSKLELLQEEHAKLQKQYEEAVVERNTAHSEHKILQQHVTSAIQAANRDKGDILKELSGAKVERDKAEREKKQLMVENLHFRKDISRIRRERDAIVGEYTLVMSERDTVHKEMEQLQDKCGEAKKKAENLDSDKRKLTSEIESLKHELASTLAVKERVLKQMSELKEKYDRRAEGMDHDRDGSHKDFDRLMPERGSGRREAKDLFDGRLMESKELESLRKETERLQSELQGESCRQQCNKCNKVNCKVSHVDNSVTSVTK